MSDPRILTVDWVAESTAGGVDHWVIHWVDQDGNGSGYRMHKSLLEWRVAEYGLTDVDDALDIALHEPHLPDEPGRDDAAARVGYVTSTSPDAEPVILRNALSTADALAAHRLRVAETKRVTARVQSPAEGRDPLAVIRARHGINPQRVREKREAVDIHRWQLVYGDLPVPLPSPSSLLEVPRA